MLWSMRFVQIEASEGLCSILRPLQTLGDPCKPLQTLLAAQDLRSEWKFFALPCNLKPFRNIGPNKSNRLWISRLTLVLQRLLASFYQNICHAGKSIHFPEGQSCKRPHVESHAIMTFRMPVSTLDKYLPWQGIWLGPPQNPFDVSVDCFLFLGIKHQGNSPILQKTLGGPQGPNK